MENDLESFVKNFNLDFEKLIREKITNSTNFSNTEYYNNAVNQVSHIAEPGKRVRPYITNLTFTTLHQNGIVQNVTRTPISHLLNGIELFHLFALIHDDLCDRAQTRRGIDCINTYLVKNYKLPKHEADSLTMLIGDLVLTWATEEIVLNNTTEVSRTYFQMVKELVYGESIDVAQAVLPAVDSSEMLSKTSFKSAKYTFQHPLTLAFSYSGIMPNQEILDGIHEIGMAFQIQDDYLDLTRLESETGKPEMNDLQEGQQTFFTDYLYHHSSDKYRIWLDQHRGQKLDQTQIDAARELFASSGALAAGKAEFEERYRHGLAMLLAGYEKILPVNSPKNSFKEWRDLVDILSSRNK